jgi:hypothetical protein
MSTVRPLLRLVIVVLTALSLAAGQGAESAQSQGKKPGKTAAPAKNSDTEQGGSDQGCTPQTKSNPAESNPVITSNVTEGAKAVSGTIQQLNSAKSGTTCSAKVELWLQLMPGDTQRSTDGQGHQTKTTLGAATVSGNQFNIKLSDALVEGQAIFVAETISNSSGNTTTDETTLFSDVVDVAGFGNWGLVRAYFTSGFLLSQDQGNFSQSNLFLAFTMDKTWKMPGYYLGHKHTDGKKVPALKWPPGINSFFETRLTAVPVTSCVPSSATGSSGSSGSGTSSACSSTTSGSTTTFDTFLANQKTARLDVGAYMPFTMTAFTYKGTPNALFLAPIAKIGFDTPAGSLSQTQPSNTTTSGTTSTGTVTALNPTNFYKFYTFGGRFGHNSMTNSRDEAPETLSYLDFSFGRFSNLESLVQTPAFAASRERLWRISVEGILKIPSTPLIIGVSANVGMSNPNAPKIVQSAGDDLRFLFGAKFDVAKLLARVVQVSP